MNMEKLDQIRKFRDLKPGETMDIQLDLLQPSQPDDYMPSLTDGPISVCCDKGKVLIIDGNHRYWEEHDKSRDGELTMILVKKTENPHEMY